MNNRTTKWILAAAFGIFVANVSSADAQSTLGGAKIQQNKIGGVAKPAPVIGGAAIHAPSPAPPKPLPVVGLAKPGSPGAVTPLGQTPGPRPGPSVIQPKSGPVVTSNLKCASGVCTSRGPKP